MKKYIIPSSVALVIVVGVLFINFKNTSDEISVTTIIQKEEETKTELETNTGEIKTEEILSQINKDIIHSQIEIFQEEKVFETNRQEVDNLVIQDEEDEISHINTEKINSNNRDILSELDSLLPSQNHTENDSNIQNNLYSYTENITSSEHTQEIETIINDVLKKNIISDEVKINLWDIQETKNIETGVTLLENQKMYGPYHLSDEDGEYIFNYKPEQEWFSPSGDVDSFELTQTGIEHAYGKNYKHFYINLDNVDSGKDGVISEDIVWLLQKYTDKTVYILDDEQEGGRLWDIHLDFESKEESQEIFKKLEKDINVYKIEYPLEIMPDFYQYKDEIKEISRENFYIELGKFMSQSPVIINNQETDEEEDEDEIEDIDENNNLKVTTLEPDFQADEYYQKVPEIAPIIHNYEPKEEWFIPKGNPEEFALDEQNIWNASGINFKHFSLSIKQEYVETELATLRGMTNYLKQYIQEDFYFVGDNEEESQYWKIHVNVNSITEANNLIKEIKQDGNIIYSVYNVGGILPQFKDQEEIIDQKQADFSID